MQISTGKRELLSQVLDTTGFNRILQLARTWRGLLVLNYHRIGRPGDSLFERGLWSATEEDFNRQVEYLTRHFDVIGLDDLDDIVNHRSGRHVMITFDDGYRDSYDTAFPILRSHGANAAFFICTGFIDSPRLPWWDEIAWMVHSSPKTRIERNVWTIDAVDFDMPHCSAAIHRLLSSYKKLDGYETEPFLDFLAEETESGRYAEKTVDQLWMNWDMIREMRLAGMSFGGHTVNHPVLSNLLPEEQDREIGHCQCRLEIQLGEPITAFSYPVGGPNSFDEVTRACLQNHGFRYAFSYYGGYSRLGGFDPFDIPRVAVETEVSAARFRSVASLPQVFAW